MEKIAQGAEASIFRKDSSVLKERLVKEYRHPAIDTKLRKFRTRREAKVLKKLEEAGIPAPRIRKMDDKDMLIEMEFLEGEKVRDVLGKDKSLSKQIGRLIAMLHSNDIIHHDLTTSNMILKDGKVHLIDFGLSFFSDKVEDRAVDLHLLKHALDSKHSDIAKECFHLAIEEYKNAYKDADSVLSRLEQVELRGRNKKKSH